MPVDTEQDAFYGEAQWYAIHTRSNFETKVACELEAKGFECYLAVFDEIHAWKDRRKVIRVPVFPCYVFARFADGPKPRADVLRTAGVARILGSGPALESIPNHQIEAIRLALASGPAFVYPFLREGVRVRVRRGALRDVEGLLVRIKNSARLVISIELLHQSIATEIDISDVERVSGGASAGADLARAARLRPALAGMGARPCIPT